MPDDRRPKSSDVWGVNWWTEKAGRSETAANGCFESSLEGCWHWCWLLAEKAHLEKHMFMILLRLLNWFRQLYVIIVIDGQPMMMMTQTYCGSSCTSSTLREVVHVYHSATCNWWRNCGVVVKSRQPSSGAEETPARCIDRLSRTAYSNKPRSRKASGDLTQDLTVLSRDFAVKNTCEATTSKSVQFTTDPCLWVTTWRTQQKT